jgi:hypothetical protein
MAKDCQGSFHSILSATSGLHYVLVLHIQMQIQKRNLTGDGSRLVKLLGRLEAHDFPSRLVDPAQREDGFSAEQLSAKPTDAIEGIRRDREDDAGTESEPVESLTPAPIWKRRWNRSARSRFTKSAVAASLGAPAKDARSRAVLRL